MRISFVNYERITKELRKNNEKRTTGQTRRQVSAEKEHCCFCCVRFTITVNNITTEPSVSLKLSYLYDFFSRMTANMAVVDDLRVKAKNKSNESTTIDMLMKKWKTSSPCRESWCQHYFDSNSHFGGRTFKKKGSDSGI